MKSYSKTAPHTSSVVGELLSFVIASCSATHHSGTFIGSKMTCFNSWKRCVIILDGDAIGSHDHVNISG